MEAVIFAGVPGSGKTTFFSKRFLQRYVRISMDLLRTRRREQIFLQTCFDTQQRFVVDNTNVLRIERQRYITQAKAARFHIVGYVFETALGDALRRNRQREGKAIVPAVGVVSKYKRFEMPEYSEGFDELFRVAIDAGEQFVVVPLEREV